VELGKRRETGKKKNAVSSVEDKSGKIGLKIIIFWAECGERKNRVPVPFSKLLMRLILFVNGCKKGGHGERAPVWVAQRQRLKTALPSF